MRRLLVSLIAISLPTLARVVPAQSGESLVPADCHLVVHGVGWPTAQRVHADDRMGKIMSSAALAEYLTTAGIALRPLLEELVENRPADFPLTREELLELPRTLGSFDGSVTLGLHLGPKARHRLTELEIADVGCILQISPTGNIDFAPLTELLEYALDQLPGLEWSEVAAGGLDTEFARVDLGSDLSLELTKPFVHEGQWCLVAAGDVKAFLGTIAAAQESVDVDRASMFMSADVMALTSLALSAGRWVGGMDDADLEQAVAVIRSLGLDSLGDVRTRVHSAAGRQYTDLTVTWPGGPRGVVRAFAPSEPGRSPLQRLVPYRLQQATLMHIDFKQLYRDAMRVLATPVLAVDEGAVVEMFEEKFKLHPFEDVVAHLGTDYMQVSHEVLDADDLLEDETLTPQQQRAVDKNTNTCHFLSLSDGAAFGKSLDRIVRTLTLHTGRKRVDYRGQRVYTIQHALLPVTVHYAVTPTVFMLGFDEGALEAIHAVVDEMVNAAAGKPATLPQQVAEVVRQQPEGYYAFGHVNLGETLGLLEAISSLVRDSFGEEFDVDLLDDDGLKAAMMLLSGLGELVAALDVAGQFEVGFLTYQNDSVSYRSIW